MHSIFSIGYAAYSIDAFVQQLKKYNITCIVDVRSHPFSQYNTDYNKDTLEAKLNGNRILYRNYAVEFGARQSDKSYYSKDGYMDFEVYAKSKQFKQGVQKIIKGMNIGYVFALMCAEKDPINCHRSILIGRQFSLAGVPTYNILADDKIETQAELESRLLIKHFSNREQLSFFGGNKSEVELINQAYRLQNATIGYRIEDT